MEQRANIIISNGNTKISYELNPFTSHNLWDNLAHKFLELYTLRTENKVIFLDTSITDRKWIDRLCTLLNEFGFSLFICKSENPLDQLLLCEALDASFIIELDNADHDPEVNYVSFDVIRKNSTYITKKNGLSPRLF